MFLNSNTATRSFRELQYDLNELLRVVGAINPIAGEDEDGEDIIVAKWADGSTSMLVSFSLIKMMMNGTFSTLKIGNKASNTLTPIVTTVPIQGGKYQKQMPTLMIKTSVGLKIRILEMGDDNDIIHFVNSRITTLNATYVTLPNDAVIKNLDVPGNAIDTDTLVIIDTATIKNLLTANSVSAETANLSKIPNLQCPVVISPNHSVYVLTSLANHRMGYWKKGLEFYDVAILSDNLYFMEQRPTYNRYPYGSKITINTQVPCPGGKSASPLKPVDTTILTYNEIYQPLPYDSGASLLMIYPMKTVMMETTANYTVNAAFPVDSANYRVSLIKNTGDKIVKVCNAWQFKIASDGIHGTITPLSFVEIPPQSNIDFVFLSEKTSIDYKAYMLPTKKLNWSAQ